MAKDKQPAATAEKRVPEGLWMRCPGCENLIYRKQVEESFGLCPDCSYHFRLPARRRIRSRVRTPPRRTANGTKSPASGPKPPPVQRVGPRRADRPAGRTEEVGRSPKVGRVDRGPDHRVSSIFRVITRPGLSRR